jgi:hypothetical protein
MSDEWLTPVGFQKSILQVENPVGKLRKYFSGRKTSFGKLRKYFFGRKTSFGKLRKYFFGRKTSFRKLRKYFFGRKASFEKLRKPYLAEILLYLINSPSLNILWIADNLNYIRKKQPAWRFRFAGCLI